MFRAPEPSVPGGSRRAPPVACRDARAHRPGAARPPKNFLRPCLLLLLHESPARGYDLRERLRSLGFSRDDPGRLHRALRGLEPGGLVRSTWEASTGGPDRRRYELTPDGEQRLRDAAAELRAMYGILGSFLGRCDTCPGLDAAARPT